MKIKFKNEGTKALVIESLLIIFSVMLGLLANDFRASINKKETAQKAWGNIINEVKHNTKDLESAIKRQESLRSDLNTLLKEKGFFSKSQKNFFDIIYSAGGVNFPEISTVAWETAKNRGTIENFSYDQLLLLTNVSEKTQAINNIKDKILNIIYNKDMFNTKFSKALANTMRITLSDLIRSEKDLLSGYKKLQHNS